MKISSIIVCIIISLGLHTSSLCINPPDDITDNVSAAIRSGNSEKLSTYFGSTIDLSLPGNEGTYSKAQAKQIIKNFFENNPPKSFTIKNQGTSKAGAKFSIGILISSKNTSFRTYFLIKKISDKSYIQQLIFEKQ